MIRTLALGTLWAAVAAAGLAALPSSGQNPPTQNPQQPVFRGEVDLIRLDVSVLDRQRRPVRGLALEDFSVTEDGKPQRVVAVTEIDAEEHDPAPSAWMRHVPRDVAANDLAEEAGNGKVVAIVIDDWNLPWDDLDIAMAARATARYIIDGLGPSDLAAVVFPLDAGRTQDFTTDRAALLEAVDRYNPRERPWIYERPLGPGPGGGDMPQRFAPVLMWPRCLRIQPTVPVLEILASRLSTIPERRKTIVLVSTGLPISFVNTRDCNGDLVSVMQNMFRIAQRANINVHSVDPAGLNGYVDYLLNPVRPSLMRPGGPGRPPPQRAAEESAKVRREFMQITAEYTGAHAVVRTNDIEGGLDRIIAEQQSYYLVGYQSSNGKPDGRFRRVEVKVNRPGVTVRTRSGYYAPREGELQTRESRAAPSTTDLGLVGLMGAPGLPLRAVATPLARTGEGRDVEVGIVLTPRLPAPTGAIEEQLTVTRHIYDADGNATPIGQEKWPFALRRSGGDALRYDVFYRMTLAPGRYQLRFNAHSTALGRSGTIYADVVVPDFTRAAVSLSGLALGTRVDPSVPREDALADLVPLEVTSARDFAPNGVVTAALRVYQGDGEPLAPANVAVQVLDAADKRVFETVATLAPEAFGIDRGSLYLVDVPLGGLEQGPYLLSIRAAVPGRTPARRDLVFRVR